MSCAVEVESYQDCLGSARSAARLEAFLFRHSRVLRRPLRVSPLMAFSWGWAASLGRWFGLVLVAGAACGAARADAVLMLEDPIHLVGHMTSVGHSVVWLDRLCTDDHVTMRRCRADEAGSVVSRYPGMTKGPTGVQLDWLAEPVGQYLFAVDRLEDVPATMTQENLDRLQAAYQSEHGPSFAVDPGKTTWTAITGESYRRRIVMIRVHTTEEQDVRLMQWLNDQKNVGHYKLFYPNCADFVGDVLGVLFPHAFHRSYLFDAGMMTPKQNLTSLHHYATRHKELGWEVTVLPQVPGTIKRSGHLRGVTEAYLKSWWFLLPLDVLDPFELGAVTG
jgi:hypothetical protein